MGLFRHIMVTTLTGLVIARVMTEASPRFGGENPLGSAPDPENWHHEGITKRAAESAGWSDNAGQALAFHNDYVDSYLYNPLWWFDITSGGGRDRFAAALSTRHELEKLHFDDLFSQEDVNEMWDRYLGGTLTGLAWIASSNHSSRLKVSLAHNLVGASLHAIQDFYSHSNWIDESDRRARTWFDVPGEERDTMSLWTGSYEKPDQLGIEPHGDFLFGCTVVNNIGSAGRSLMRIACHAASPFSDSTFCQMLRACDEAEAIDVPKAWQDVVPDALRGDLVWVKPGINLDSRWLAGLGVRERGLSDLDGETAFTTAYQLAVRNSCQWLRSLEESMNRADLGDFWSRVMQWGVSEQNYQSDTAPFENMALIPYQFITAGPYPPERDTDEDEDLYLRLEISTADVTYAGTDADIVPYVNGIECPRLDHAKQAQVPEGEDRAEESLMDNVLSIDDFERSSTAAYILGPFKDVPHTLALKNTAPDFGDLILAALEALGEAIVGILEGIRDFFRALTGYHPDFVGSDHLTFDPETLNSIPLGGHRVFDLTCDGGSEGRYRVHGAIYRQPVPAEESEAGIPLSTYLVRFTRLHCEKESEWDRGTNSDEPFILGLVIPHGGDEGLTSWRSSPHTDVDTGDSRSFDRRFVVRVPEAYGSISIATAVHESDGEGTAERNDLLAEFAGQVDHDLQDPEEGFLIQLTEALGSSWRPARIDAVAFRRGRVPTIVTYDQIRPDDWIDGGTKVEWDLESRGGTRVPLVIPEDLDCPDAARPAGVPTVELSELVSRVYRPAGRLVPQFDVTIAHSPDTIVDPVDLVSDKVIVTGDPVIVATDDEGSQDGQDGSTKRTKTSRDEVLDRIRRKEWRGTPTGPVVRKRRGPLTRDGLDRRRR